MEPGGQLPAMGNTADLPAEFVVQPPLRPIATRASTEALLKYGSLILRTLAFVFSVISFSVMASNKGVFDSFDEFSYVLAACVLSAVYTLLQNIRHTNYYLSGNSLFAKCTSNLVDFVGDQIIAYLLLSSASAAAPTVSKIRDVEKALKAYGADKKVSAMSSASTGMAFLAFFPLAISAMISGYKLSTKTYV
ncbi:hypothetical protein MKW94_030798 [Papaver nudicaule]|uniref:CASP-like protein n=1 Tax=Papaver nudicaule TaxID=74823 RepID=A0AA41RT78_PAPNU|nr:hypothetical protein [Papaver nudicaule]